MDSKIAVCNIMENFTQELKFKLARSVMLEVCQVKKGKGYSRVPERGRIMCKGNKVQKKLNPAVKDMLCNPQEFGLYIIITEEQRNLIFTFVI